MLESVRKLLITLNDDSYSLGATFDLLLAKNDEKIDIKYELQKIHENDIKNRTSRAEQIERKLVNLDSKVVSFLFCLRDSAQLVKTKHQFEFGSLHPKFQGQGLAKKKVVMFQVVIFQCS